MGEETSLRKMRHLVYQILIRFIYEQFGTSLIIILDHNCVIQIMPRIIHVMIIITITIIIMIIITTIIITVII